MTLRAIPAAPPTSAAEPGWMAAFLASLAHDDLARVSPLMHAHVIPNGSYFQSPRQRAGAAAEPVMA